MVGLDGDDGTAAVTIYVGDPRTVQGGMTTDHSSDENGGQPDGVLSFDEVLQIPREEAHYPMRPELAVAHRIGVGLGSYGECEAPRVFGQRVVTWNLWSG